MTWAAIGSIVVIAICVGCIGWIIFEFQHPERWD